LGRPLKSEADIECHEHHDPNAVYDIDVSKIKITAEVDDLIKKSYQGILLNTDEVQKNLKGIYVEKKKTVGKVSFCSHA